MPSTASQQRKRLVGAANRLAADQDGVVSRAELRALGVTRWHVRTEVRAGRWRTHGRRTVAVHTTSLGERASWRAAVYEVGGDAALDGVTALRAAGLKGFDERQITVSVARGHDCRRPDGVVVRQTRWRTDADLVGAGIPRVRPATAAVRAALWATSDRQAALVVVMAVQQRLTTAVAVQEALAVVRRHRRRRLLATVVADVVDGAQSLGELDFARLCRQRGLPKPSRQVVRRGPRGRVYLDVYWDELGVVVEIEGIHHGAGATQLDDALRQNTLSLQRDLVLRIPLLGLRLMEDEFMRQVEQALRSRRPAVA